MKKLMIVAFGCLMINGLAQQDKSWRLGLQWGFQGNGSEFSGGMENANARFHHNSFGGGALNVIVRHDYTKHWMATTGLGIHTFGFDFALSKNYSLRKEEDRFSPLRSEFAALEVPTLIFYKFNPNCRNSKWMVGGGFVHTLIGSQSASNVEMKDPEGNLNADYIKTESSTNEELTCMLRFVVSKEKVYKRGAILNASMLFNIGLKEIAKANVTYQVDGQQYQHEFVNSGSFIGFRLTYFFRSFGS